MNEILATLGSQNVDFNSYNYNATKPLLELAEIIIRNLETVSVRVMMSGSVKVLNTIIFNGNYRDMPKKEFSKLRSVGSLTNCQDNIALLIGTHHAGFDGAILASLVLRHVLENNLEVTHVSNDCVGAVKSLDGQLRTGVKAVLNKWTPDELFYIYRECHINPGYVELALGDDDSMIACSYDPSGRLMVKVSGPLILNETFTIDDSPGSIDINPIRSRFDLERIILLRSWMLARGYSLHTLHQLATLDAQAKEAARRAKEVEYQKKLFSPELKELVVLIAANASIALTKEDERHKSLDRLDGLVEKYIQSRKSN